MTLTPGTHLGLYDITAPIGEGAWGKCFAMVSQLSLKLKEEIRWQAN